MFSDKANVVQLVSLLKSHEVRNVVLCPGSRDIPLIQSITSCDYFKCYQITDERSAGFFALGVALKEKAKVAVVVTSGSALLNLHPAVSEAFYQKLPLIVISADRPQAWIGQMDGQTLPQTNVFGSLVKKSVDLREFDENNSEERWFNNRLINEALLSASFEDNGPVHINVQISDPFFSFTRENLMQERVIHRYELFQSANMLQDLLARPLDQDELNYFKGIENAWAKLFNICYRACPRVLLILGQGVAEQLSDTSLEQLKSLSSKVYCYAENLTNLDPTVFNSKLDTLLGLGVDPDFNLRPQAVLSFGGHIISKRLKKFLRKNPPLYHYHICPKGEIIDLFQCLTGTIKMPYDYFVQSLYEGLLDIDDAAYETMYYQSINKLNEDRANYLMQDETESEENKEQEAHKNGVLDNEDKASALFALFKEQAEGEVDEALSQNFLDITSLKEMSIAQINASLRESGADWTDFDDSSLLNGKEYVSHINGLCARIPDHPLFAYTQMYVIGETLRLLPENSVLHLANSSTVRYAQLFKLNPSIKVYSNRGTNGIEGSLSTALGFACADPEHLNFVIIGDLSFFYDMNALWQNNTKDNVRILLINNYSGEIFHALPGLKLVDRSLDYVTAVHNTSAKGWAQSRGYKYLSAHDPRDFSLNLKTFVQEQSDAPIVFEVFTDKYADVDALKDFYLKAN